jgi:hypothetical protein
MRGSSIYNKISTQKLFKYFLHTLVDYVPSNWFTSRRREAVLKVGA